MRPPPFSWSLQPEVLALLALAVGAYAYGVRDSPPSRPRAAAFGTAIVLVLATGLTPLHSLTFHLLSAHLLQNIVLAE